jgi:uncharacterized membrane protein
MNTLRSFFSFLGSIFLTGLLSLLPLTLTITLISFSIKTIKSWLNPLYLLEPSWLQAIPFSEFILAIILIFIVGIILHFLLLQPLFHFIESAINKIPLVRPIYTGFKQLTQAFNSNDQASFKQVVMIEFPRQGFYSLGFVTSEVSPTLAPSTSQKYFCVFVPTTPMPTNGYFLIIAQENLRPVDISRQEAMTLIISGGIIQPSLRPNGPFDKAQE